MTVFIIELFSGDTNIVIKHAFKTLKQAQEYIVMGDEHARKVSEMHYINDYFVPMSPVMEYSIMELPLV